MAGKETTQKPHEKLADWMEVLQKTHLGHRDDPRVLERIKEQYRKQYIINPEDVPESYFENQKRLAREQGHGEIEITREMRKQLIEVITNDQKSTLDNWMDYFTLPDSKAYPMWAKYWAFKSMLKLSSYDKEKHAFGKRDKGTVAPFPDLNRASLAYVMDKIIKQTKEERIPEAEGNPELQKLLQGANFGKLYAWAIEKETPTEKKKLINTKGKWKRYVQGSNHMPLVESLQGYGTGWCTAGETMAEVQLQGGDFHVYYSENEKGEPIIPRAAIRMQENQIAEVRGIGPEQNLDPHINDVVKKKMQEFPDGKLYEKKALDMKLLTTIDDKTKQGQELTKDELIFLYEVDALIQGFGYQKDPRIKEIRGQRNSKEDAPIALDCAPNEIAWNKDELNKNTKAYIGPLFPNIFQTLAHLEHIYASFPEGKIRKQTIEIGGKTKEELKAELKKAKINVSPYAKQMMENKDFTTLKKPESAILIRLKVKDLSISKEYPTTDDIYKRAKELGLELCPQEVGPQLRLQYMDQPLGEWLNVGMKQMAGPDGYPRVFSLERDVGGLWLHGHWAEPTSRWHPGAGFVFRLRKLEI